ARSFDGSERRRDRADREEGGLHGIADRAARRSRRQCDRHAREGARGAAARRPEGARDPADAASDERLARSVRAHGRQAVVIRPLIAIAALAATASAQPHPKKTPTPKELDAARAHFRDAEAAKARGDFQTAAVEYLAAYELFEEPEFFFDVAEVYRLAGN